MFSLHRLAESSIRRKLQIARSLPVSYKIELDTQRGPQGLTAPPGYVLDHTHGKIGRGEAAFDAAKSALRQWKHFDLGWVRVANPEAPIAPGEVIAVEVHALGLWSLNLSRILYVIDEPNRFGFAYGTTPLHAERGEERFLLKYDPDSGNLSYDLLALSQPAHPLAKLAYPYTRSLQHRFARDSVERMKRAVSDLKL